MNLKIFFSTVLVMSFILIGLIYITDQNVDASDNYYGINFVAPLDPYQIVSHDRYYDLDSHGIVYLSINPSFGELSYRVFVEGMSYLEGDDI